MSSGEMSTTNKEHHTVSLSIGGSVHITAISYEYREGGVSGMAEDALESAQEMFEDGELTE